MKKKHGDLTFVAMMLGASRSHIDMAIYDLSKGSGRWRVRAFGRIFKALDGIEMARRELVDVKRRPRQKVKA